MFFYATQNWALVQHPNTLVRAHRNLLWERSGDKETYSLEPLRNIVTADFAYVRLHGNDDDHTYCYSDSELCGYAEQLQSWRTREGRCTDLY